MVILAIFISIFFPFLGYVLGFLGLIYDKKHWKGYALCLSFAMANLAYFYVPKEDTDLVRYLDYVESMATYSFGKALNRDLYREGGLYIFNFFCWIFNRLNIPNMVPALSIFIIFYLFLKITYKSAIIYEVKNKNIVFYLIFGLLFLNFYSLVNNVRNVLSFAIIAYAIFRDVIEKKRDMWTFVLYVCPIFIHTTSIVIILIRLLSLFPKIVKIIAMCVLLIAKPVLTLIYPSALSWSESNFIFKIIKRIVIKGYQYFNDTTSEWGQILANSLTQKITKLIVLILLVLFGIMLVKILVENKKKKNAGNQIGDTNRIFEVTLFISAFVLVCLDTTMGIYWRFALLLIIIGSPTIFAFSKNKFKSVFQLLLICIGCCYCALWVRDLIRYSDINSILLKPLYSNIWFDIIERLLKLI